MLKFLLLKRNKDRKTVCSLRTKSSVLLIMLTVSRNYYFFLASTGELLSKMFTVLSSYDHLSREEKLKSVGFISMNIKSGDALSIIFLQCIMLLWVFVIVFIRGNHLHKSINKWSELEYHNTNHFFEKAFPVTTDPETTIYSYITADLTLIQYQKTIIFPLPPRLISFYQTKRFSHYICSVQEYWSQRT